MEITTVKITEIRPTAGHWLTKKVVENETDRFFSDLIILAKDDSAENYEQWTDEQKQAWENEYVSELEAEEV